MGSGNKNNPLKEIMVNQNEEIKKIFKKRNYPYNTKAPEGVWAIVNGVKTEWNTRDCNITIGFIPHENGEEVQNTDDLVALSNHFNIIHLDGVVNKFKRVVRVKYTSQNAPTSKEFDKIIDEIEKLRIRIQYPHSKISSTSNNKESKAQKITKSICPKIQEREISIIQSLKRSPIFNLSLSSLELFHSNFHFWVANNYKTEFGKIFSNFCEVVPDELEIKNIYREKKHIDLSFNYSNGQEIMIENKVKSIPNLRQLLAYSRKFGPTINYVLLSLSKPVFFKENIFKSEEVLWHYMSYEELKNKLEYLIKNVTDSYHKNVIEDYIVLLTGIINISNLCKLELEDYYVCQFRNENILEPLREIRLHDIYLKKKAELFAYEIYKKLLEKKVNGLLEFGEEIDWSKKNNQIFTGSNYTQSGGVLIDLKFKVSSEYALVIQIQDGVYRLAVEVPKNTKAINIANDLDSKFNWFDFDKELEVTKVYPTKGGFNQFKEHFRHRQVKINNETKINNIINIMLRDFDRINKIINL